MQDERKKICPKSAIDQVLAGLGVDEDCTVDEEVKYAIWRIDGVEEKLEMVAGVPDVCSSCLLSVFACSAETNHLFTVQEG
jgi:hypothetical protein